MAAMDDAQRTAILERYGGLVRTYFSREELREARFSYRPRLSAIEVEFHAYLRLASILLAGRHLPPILRQITLAPSSTQERVLQRSKGSIQGRLDARAYIRQRGQLSSPRTFPSWRVRSTHVTPENALAASAAWSLLTELQAASSQLPLEETSEAHLVREITDAIELLLRDPALGEVSRRHVPDIASPEAEGLFESVARRWHTRRISNTAYFQLWQWADQYRKRGLADDGILAGVAYSEDFDNRLFEIFAVGCLRDAFRALGFIERGIRPLHERQVAAVLEVEHPESGLSVSVFFQRGDGVLWTSASPREWPKIVGVPDISLSPNSTRLPVMIIDAKNRFRGSELEESVSEELYKMLGYFENFSPRMQLQERGPIGGLIFLARGASGHLKRYESRSGGLLVACALDPSDPHASEGARALLEDMLRRAGLVGGEPEVTSAVQAIKESVWGAAAEGDPISVEEDVLDQMHQLVAARYGVPGPVLLQAKQGLELHLLGSAWSELDENEQVLLATGEVFWVQHYLAFGMDFAPVVVELSRALEVVINRVLFQPFYRWGAAHGSPASKLTLTLGQMRATVDAAKAVAAGTRRAGDAVALHAFLGEHGVTNYAYGEFLSDLGVVNGFRRKAAHKEMVTGADAGQLRERILGVGSASPVLARVVLNLKALLR